MELIVCADSPKRPPGNCPNLLGGRSKTRSNAAAFGRCIGSRFATLISSGRLIELHAPAKLIPMQRPLDLLLQPALGFAVLRSRLAMQTSSLGLGSSKLQIFSKIKNQKWILFKNQFLKISEFLNF